MATVRTTAPRQDPEAEADPKSKNKKRKRSASSNPSKARATAIAVSSSSSSSNSSSGVSPHAGGMDGGGAVVDATVHRRLDAHNKWQICTQKNLSEIRAECMKVRRELERVEQMADTAVVQVQDEAANFRSMQEQVEKQAKATVAYVETLQRDVESASVALQTELQTLKKKVRTIDQRVQQQVTQSIDEDSLMTQLTELQERYETELNQHKDAFLAQLLDKQQALDGVKTQLNQLNQVGRQEREDASRATSVLDTQLKSLKQHVYELDRERQASADKQGRLKGELDDLGHRVDRELDNTKHQFQQQLQHLQDQYLKFQTQHQVHQHPMPLRHVPPPPPPPSFQHPFSSSEDPVIKEKLHLLGRDVHLVAEDLRRFTVRFDSRLDEVHQDFTVQLRDLRGELFAALDHDSRLHVVENKRLRDMVFDLEGTFRDGMGRMDDNARRMDEHVRYIEETVRRMAAERQASQSPPRRPLDVYPARSNSSRHYEDRRGSGGSLYNDQPGMRAAPLNHVGPTVAPRRSRSRSNSRDRMQQRLSVGRSPHRSECRPELPSSTFHVETGITALNNRSVSPEADQHQSSSQPTSRAANSVQSDDVQMGVVSDSGPNSGARALERTDGDREQRDRVPSGQEQTEHRPTAPVRRNKKPRKPHEVIVIEDDESADDMVVAPDRAPPDVVTEDDEDSRQPRIVVIYEEGDVDRMDRGDASSSDHLKRLSDLRLGSLLYFCFGGAPSLDFEWTRYFSKLNPGDCIEMSQATSFLHRYSSLHSFPIYLAQFIVQAIVVEVPLGGIQSEPLAFGLDDGSLIENVGPALVTDQFHQVLGKIRLSWAETLVVKLQKMLERTRDGNPASADLQLSVNPALIEQVGEAKKTNATSWQQQQAKSLWLLLRSLRFASTMPAFAGDMVASPGVYVFLLMFDVVQVNRLSPQSGTFRLTNWGRMLVTQLWDHLLSKLPYLLFADCSWLESQTDSSGTLPTLGFCHILSAILAWTSITDKAIESSTNFYSELVRLFLDCLHVNCVRVRDSEGFVSLMMNEVGANGAAASEIELIGVGTKLISLLQLDGFFEVANAISSQATAIASIAATDTVKA